MLMGSSVRALEVPSPHRERLLDFNLALLENMLLIPVVNFIMCHFPPLFGSKDED